MANRSDEWPDLHPQILDTNSLPLPAAIRFKLIHAGLRSISDLSGFQPRTLAQGSITITESRSRQPSSIRNVIISMSVKVRCRCLDHVQGVV